MAETMKIEDMNEGVRLILSRMDTHPEEFEEGMGHMRWMRIMEDVRERIENDNKYKLRWLKDAEVEAMYDKLATIHRDLFTAEVIRWLADPDESNQSQMNLPYIPAMPRQTYGLNVEEFKTATRLGVSPKVFAQAKQAEQAEIEKQRRAYQASKGIK
jgi:hypothetical protein